MSVTIVIGGFAQAMMAPKGVIMPPLPKPLRGLHSVRMYKPTEVRKWQGDAKQIAITQMQGKVPLSGALEVHIAVYVPPPKSMAKRDLPLALDGRIRPITRPDASNYCKAIEDSLNGVVWLDDSQIVELHVSKLYSDTPRVVVTVEPFNQPVAQQSGSLFENKGDRQP